MQMKANLETRMGEQAVRGIVQSHRLAGFGYSVVIRIVFVEKP